MPSPAWWSSARLGARVPLLCMTCVACRGGGDVDARPVETRDSVVISGLIDGALRICADGPGRAEGNSERKLEHGPTAP